MKPLAHPCDPPRASTKSNPTPPPIASLEAPPVQMPASTATPPPLARQANESIPKPPPILEPEGAMPWAFIALSLGVVVTVGLAIWMRTDTESPSLRIASARPRGQSPATMAASKRRHPLPAQRATTSLAPENETARPTDSTSEQDEVTPRSNPSNGTSDTESTEQPGTTPTAPATELSPTEPNRVETEPDEAENTPPITSTAKAKPLDPSKENPLSGKGETFLDEPATCDSDRKLGTSVVWAESADEASDLAQQQNKLVYLIQVSGNFEIEEFT